MIQAGLDHRDEHAAPELAEARSLAEDALQAITNRLADQRAAALPRAEREAIAESAARLRIVMLGSDSTLIERCVADMLRTAAQLSALFDEPLAAKGQAAG